MINNTALPVLSNNQYADRFHIKAEVSDTLIQKLANMK